MVLLHRLLSSAYARSFFFLFFPRLSDSPSPRLSPFALDLCVHVCVCVCRFACVLKQSNLLRLDQKKRSLGKLPDSGCVQGLRVHALFFTVYLFAVAAAGGLRVGIWRWVGWGGCVWVKEAEETHR